MGADVELLCENLPVSRRLIQHDDHVAVLENILDLTRRKKVFHVLGQPCGDAAPLAEALPDLHGISGGLLLFQQKVHLIHIIPGGLAAAAVCRDTPPHLILHNEHSQLFHLLAQFLDVIADDAVIDVHVGAMVEQVQTALDVDFQSRGNMVGFFFVLLEQGIVQVLKDGHILRAGVRKIFAVDQMHTASMTVFSTGSSPSLPPTTSSHKERISQLSGTGDYLPRSSWH